VSAVRSAVVDLLKGRVDEALADGWGVSRDDHTRVLVQLACGSATGVRDA
jgi:hypothetical protein